MGHLRYDKDLQQFVPHFLKQDNTIHVDISIDVDSYRELGGDITEDIEVKNKRIGVHIF